MTSTPYHAGQNAQYTLSLRPITDGEVQAAVASLRPARYNAIFWAIVTIISAVVVNMPTNASDYVSDYVFVFPVFFAVLTIDPAVRYRKAAATIRKASEAGAIPELRAYPVRKSRGRGWALGPVALPSTKLTRDALSESSPASMAFLSDVNLVLSLNGVPLKKPVRMIAPRGFGKDMMAQPLSIQKAPMAAAPAVPQPTPSPAPQPVGEELPPPPDDWVPAACPKCGQNGLEGFSFCPRCGFKLRP